MPMKPEKERSEADGGILLGKGKSTSDFLNKNRVLKFYTYTGFPSPPNTLISFVLWVPRYWWVN